MLYTVDQLSGRPIREGELLTASAVGASNIVRDVREILTNTFGGRMRRYESLVENSADAALAALAAKAKAKGYDGVVAVRLASPSIVDGSAAVLAYGTAFHFVSEKSAPGG
ncbi:MAG: heavy metal-binding domain-containing protein [Hyphomicrobiales bacterium]|nr:heavy metal-binding domain-containing protein [Hyphomicrobiales bacterium]